MSLYIEQVPDIKDDDLAQWLYQLYTSVQAETINLEAEILNLQNKILELESVDKNIYVQSVPNQISAVNPVILCRVGNQVTAKFFTGVNLSIANDTVIANIPDGYMPIDQLTGSNFPSNLIQGTSSIATIRWQLNKSTLVSYGWQQNTVSPTFFGTWITSDDYPVDDLIS